MRGQKKKIAGNYSEGLIRVDSIFEMSGKKAGFIDTSGRLVIPYKFKISGYNNLNDFHEGLALYAPENTDEYQYAYINKKGEIDVRIKVPSDGKRLNISKVHGDFIDEYAQASLNSKPVYIDKSGTLQDVAELVKTRNEEYSRQFDDFDIPFMGNAFDYWTHKSNNLFRFECTVTTTVQKEGKTSGFGSVNTYTRNVKKKSRGVGIADINGKILIAPIFSEIGFPDKVSGLTLATSHKENYNSTAFTGYVDSKGIFQIILEGL